MTATSVSVPLKCVACGHEGAVGYDAGPDGKVAPYCLDIVACGRRRHEKDPAPDDHTYSTIGWDWHGQAHRP